MNYNRFVINFKVGVEALLANRFRAVLTSLGIIFGVASVIAMLAIGSGAEKEILEQMKEVGINNIIIKPRQISTQKTTGQSNASESDENDNSGASGNQPGGNTKRNTSPGLSLNDVHDMLETIPSINYISPEVEIETSFMYNGLIETDV